MSTLAPSSFDDSPDALDMRDADIERLENLQAMAMTFATWLHQKGAEQMEKGGEKSCAEIRQLSHSFNRAARAVRQIVVIKHEIAELRPMPGSRPVAAPANQNAPSRHGSPQHAARYGQQRDRSDLDDLTDEERQEIEVEVDSYIRKLLDALQIDIEASGRPELAEEAARESTATKLSTIAASISHPTLDGVLAGIEMKKLWDIFAPKYIANRALGPPPPRGWPDDA